MIKSSRIRDINVKKITISPKNNPNIEKISFMAMSRKKLSNQKEIFGNLFTDSLNESKQENTFTT